MKRKIWSAQELISFEDDQYIVINKPPHLSTLEDRNDPQHVLGIFRAIYPEIQVCHRLDKETSGALLLAKTDLAYKEAALLFQERQVEKVYHALVKGHFPDEVIQVDMPLRTTGSGRVRIDQRLGKEAITLFRPKEYIGKYTLVEAKPLTGRTHQIRVHLAYLEFPICGDEYYGGEPIFLSQLKKNYKPKADQEERPLFSRVALHAHSLSLNPIKNTSITQYCEYYSDLSMIIRKIRKFN